MNTKKIFLLSLLLAGSMQVAQCHDAVPNANDFLIEAVCNADVKKVKTLLRTYVDVNKPDEEGYTPLFYAVGEDNLEIVNLLIQADAHVDFRSIEGETPIFCADSVEVAQALIDAGADVRVRTYVGNTVLFECRGSSLLNLFIQKGIDVNAQNNSGNTALHNAVWNRNLTKIDTLIASGASIWIKNMTDQTVVDIAYQWRSTDSVLYLINSDTQYYYATLNRKTFFKSMIKQLITDIKGKYLSENSACGYSYSKDRYQNTMRIVDAMLKKGYYYDILNHEIATLDELTKGSQAEQDLCAEFQVLSKTLSLYNYKKAMKVELQALDNELQAKYYPMYRRNGDVDVVSKSSYNDGVELLALAALFGCVVAYAMNDVDGHHDAPLNQFVDGVVKTAGSAIAEFAANIDFPSFVSI